MTWTELELIFNRAFTFSFSRKKLIFFFPILLMCAFLVVLCRALALSASDWVTMSLAFLPVFVCSALLLAVGVLLIRVYHDEVKQIDVSFRQTLRKSWDLMVAISHLSLPLFVAYLLLWTMLGLFYLLREIPFVGSGLALFFSFVPFLLVLGSLVLAFLNLLLLFFLTPAVALQSQLGLGVGEKVWARIKKNPFTHLALFFMGFLPFILVGGVLLLAGTITGASYIEATDSLTYLLQSSLIMLPFCALVAPAIIFFFNFAAESYVLMRRKEKSESET
jgi:hypothetical protein